MIVNVLLFLASTLFILYYYFTRNFNYWKSRNVVGPKPVPLFGNILESTLRRKHMGDVFMKLYNQYPKEKFIGIYRMTSPSLLVRDLDLVKHVMIKDFDAFSDRGVEFDKDYLGKNLFHADSETWNLLRNKFTPLFTSGKLKNMMYLLIQRSDHFMEYVESTCRQNTEQEVHGLVQKFTISSIASTAFGIDIDINGKMMTELQKMNDKIFHQNLFHELDMMYPGILNFLSANLFPKSIKPFFSRLVETIKVQRNNSPTNRKDFMDLILELRQEKQIKGQKWNQDNSLDLEITDSIIAAQAFIFYIGGYETSASTMAFMLYQLAQNSDVQEKLIAEIDEVLGNNNGELTYDSLNELKYLGKVFDETLRMYPIAAFLQRSAKRDYKIPDTDVTIKKGQMVLIPANGIHYDEKYYPNSKKFDPERFSPEKVGERHPCAYLPFGVGPRNCIGMRFAKVQSGICIARLLSRFRVEPSNRKQNLNYDPHKVVVNFTGGTYLNFIPRNK